MKYGAVGINFRSEPDVAARLITSTDRRGVGCVVDAVGLEAKGNIVDTAIRALMLEQGSGTVLRHGIASLKRGGTLSIPGVYTGFVHGFPIGDAFDKGLTFAMGQTHVQAHVATLLDLIVKGDIRPDAIISHRLPLEEGPRAYQLFADKLDGCRKVVLYPGGVPEAA